MAEYRMLTDADLDYVERLRTENERLRAVLAQIAEDERFDDYYAEYTGLIEIREIARKALEARDQRSEAEGRGDG